MKENIDQKIEKEAWKKQGSRSNSTVLIILAWISVLMISLPKIVYRLFVPLESGEPILPKGLTWITVICIAILWLLTWLWKTIKPLRGYFLTLLALFVGWEIIHVYIGQSAAWSNWLGKQSWGVWLVAYLGIRLVISAFVALTLIGSRIGLKDLYLVRGEPNAEAKPTPLLLGIVKEHTPWTRVIGKWIPYFIIILLVVVGIQVKPNISQVLQALRFLPFITVAAVINAFNEEFQFRSMVLSRIVNVVGSQHAIFLSAGCFGLQHYFGSPGGIFGIIMAAYLGWISAKSMVETKGFVWAFLIHFIGDFLIYIFWAMAA